MAPDVPSVRTAKAWEIVHSNVVFNSLGEVPASKAQFTAPVRQDDRA